MVEKKPLTHDAYALKRDAPRAPGRWIEIGFAHIDADANNEHDIFLDRLPIGGFTGHIHLSPKGVKPQAPTQPPRPGSPPDPGNPADEEEHM
jgi:hypothetical protein